MSLLSEQEQIEKIQILSKRATSLNEKLAGLAALKKQNESDLSNAEKNAISEFGTCDLNELRALYKSKITEQTQKIIAYEDEVNACELLVSQIERELQEVDNKYA